MRTKCGQVTRYFFIFGEVPTTWGLNQQRTRKGDCRSQRYPKLHSKWFINSHCCIMLHPLIQLGMSSQFMCIDSHSTCMSQYSRVFHTLQVTIWLLNAGQVGPVQHASQSRQVVWYMYFSQAVSSSQRRLQSMRYQSCRFPKELKGQERLNRSGKRTGWACVREACMLQRNSLHIELIRSLQNSRDSLKTRNQRSSNPRAYTIVNTCHYQSYPLSILMPRFLVRCHSR